MSAEGKRKATLWYAQGLRFECVPDCGACCTNHDDYTYVYLEREDLVRLARFLGLTVRVFCERYTELEDGHRVLRMDRPHCPFLEGSRCRVYPARPLQCRTFPFWEECLESPERWRELARFCPGIDRGPLHGLQAIRGLLAARRSGGDRR